MMGKEPPQQGKLFYSNINIGKRVRGNHPLRKVDELIDFDFIYDEVKGYYGTNGNESVPPPVILKLMLLLIFYNVRSERELMATLPERIDWLWFLGYDFDTEIPDHSVLSKARRRWGVTAFRNFFERVVLQCCNAGLVDGSKIFVDSSLVDADASNNSVVDTHSLKRYLNKSYVELERRLEESPEGCGGDDNAEHEKKGEVNRRYISTTDPDAAIVKHGGPPKLRYQTHRAVDGDYEVITATEVTGGDVNEAHRLTALIEQHKANTGKETETVVGDSKYGTIENFLACSELGVKAHMPDLKRHQDNKGKKAGIYSEEYFRYDKERDCYICPAGESLLPRKIKKKRNSIDYAASRKVCNACQLRESCTKSKTGRTVKRHMRQEELDRMRALSKSAAAKRDIRTRQHLMERSFARAKRYGYDRARWRGNWKVEIQEYLTAAIQNIEVLIRYGKRPMKCAAMALEIKNKAENASIKLLFSVKIAVEVFCSPESRRFTTQSA